MTDPALELAWAAVHDATPEDWYVGRPYFDERHNRWEQYAFDASETPVVGDHLARFSHSCTGPTARLPGQSMLGHRPCHRRCPQRRKPATSRAR